MIITRISGGIGNQMFQYAIAKSIAKNNNDCFKLDVSFFRKQKLRQYELGSFNIDEKIATEEECRALRGPESFFTRIIRRIRISYLRHESYIFEKKITQFDSSVYYRVGNIYLDGYWQNEEYFKNIRTELLNDFTLCYDSNASFLELLNQVKDTNSVALHVRRGDYIINSHTNDVHGICDIDYYIKSVLYINENVINPTFFIFSDDISWCKDNLKFIENKVFVTVSEKSVEDIILMRYCKHNIIANSSFSWWGAWLNENLDKIVIAPKQWFKQENIKYLNVAVQKWLQF